MPYPQGCWPDVREHRSKLLVESLRFALWCGVFISLRVCQVWYSHRVLSSVLYKAPEFLICSACVIALTRCYYIFQIFPVILPYFLLDIVFQSSVSILVVLSSCPALSLVCPVSLSDLPHGFPAYPWFRIGRPGCFVRDEFGCSTDNSLLKRIPCVIDCWR